MMIFVINYMCGVMNKEFCYTKNDFIFRVLLFIAYRYPQLKPGGYPLFGGIGRVFVNTSEFWKLLSYTSKKKSLE